MDNMIMSLEESRRTQRPYRYGMILLGVGALVNWLGLAQDYTEPIRYTGVACILAGACLICTAMCCWLHTPNRAGSSNENDDPIHVISAAEERRCEKPPDYDSVAVAPPSYDDAIKLDPSALLQHTATVIPSAPNCTPTVASANTTSATSSRTSSSAYSTSSTSSSTFNFSTILGLPRENRNASNTSLDGAAAISSPTATTVPSPACLSIEHEKPPPYEASRAATPPPVIVAAIPIHMNPAIMVPGSN